LEKQEKPTLTQDQALAQLKGFLTQNDRPSILEISGISPNVFDTAHNLTQVNASEFPGLENARSVNFMEVTGDFLNAQNLARIEYSPKHYTWIVTFAGCGHESLINMSRLFEYGDKAYWPPKQNDVKGLPLPGPPHIDSFGSAEVKLADRTRKAPDYSLVDATPGRPIRLKGWPSVVFELAWTQTSKEVAEVCGRWVAGSEAKVKLAICIDVILKYEKGKDKRSKDKRSKDKKGNNKEDSEEGGEGNNRDNEAEEEAENEEVKNDKRKLKKRKQREADKEIAQLWVSLWEVVEAEPLMETSEPINELLRADGEQDDPFVSTNVPPATRFTFVSNFSDFPEQIAAIGQERFKSLAEPPKYVKYHAAETQRLQVRLLLFV
jgi:hypothetical protein